MQRWPRTATATAMAEDGSTCLVRRLPWASILRAALLLFLIGAAISSILSCQRLLRQRAQEPAGVSRERRATERQPRPLLGPDRAAVRGGRGHPGREPEAEGPAAAEAGRRPERQARKRTGDKARIVNPQPGGEMGLGRGSCTDRHRSRAARLPWGQEVNPCRGSRVGGSLGERCLGPGSDDVTRLWCSPEAESEAPGASHSWARGGGRRDPKDRGAAAARL